MYQSLKALLSQYSGLLVLVALAGVMAYAAAWAMGENGPSGMEPLNDDELAEVSGQALFVSDHIEPSSEGGLTGAPGDGSADFDFYRMGMDVELGMNMNISKLQLGCGGVNESVMSGACDIDMDYVRFMGRDGSSASPAGPQSDFTLTRPMISLAIEDDNDPTSRSVAGIKVGAEAVDGFISVGRRYTDNVTNEENGGTCDPTAESGSGVVNCHSGINTLSGFIGAEMSAEFTINCTTSGCPNSDACVGYVSGNSIGGCGSGAGDRLFLDVAGTRMDELALYDALLGVDAGALLSFLGIEEGYAQLTADLRGLHGFSLENTGDFFLSFQRERIAWPRFSKTTPSSDEMTACNSNLPSNPDRCGSAYAVPANTGWWMNVPRARVMDIQGANQSMGVTELASALSSPGLAINNPELDMTPASNCYGDATFC